MSAAPPLITLLTDFGSCDTYVGQMKGAILSIASGATLVDLTHEIPPGDILSGGLAWLDSIAAFPPDTIHLGVVDPGVGSERRAIAAEIGPWRFVGPDNGLLTAVLKSQPLHRAVELRESRYWRPDVSPVFHGRDVFGPVAAHWATGVELNEFGPALSSPPVLLDIPTPVISDGAIHGCVLTTDRFGNLRTNIPRTLLPSGGRQPPGCGGDDVRGHNQGANAPRSEDEAASRGWTVEIAGTKISRLVSCFAEVPIGALCALIGSHGDLEIAVNQGNAQDQLKALRGTAVIVRL